MGGKHSKKNFSLLGHALNLGFSVVASVLIFILGGLYLDGKLGTMPLFLIAGIVLSLAASMYHVYRLIQSIKHQDDRNSA